MRVTDAEVNSAQHDAYLGIITTHSEPLGTAMLEMGTAAGIAARSGGVSDFSAAVQAISRVSERSGAFLDALASAHCPAYLRGADSAIQDALKLLIDGSHRGVRAARAADGTTLVAAAKEIEVANQDMVVAAHRITAWRSGVARP
jgi:hypothetical protein